MSELEIPTARVFEPLLGESRYKGAHGGRASGKSHFFAGLEVESSLMIPGCRTVCVREVQKSLKDSAKKLIEDKIREYNLMTPGSGFQFYHDRIVTPGDGLIVFQGMSDHNAESVKSLEGFNRAWVEEAQTLSATSLKMLRPTIRAPGSELHFSWNPRHKRDPVDEMFRGKTPPTGSVVVQANWSDNPWLPAEMEQERLDCYETDPDEYDHIWEGDYVTVVKGAYYSKHITDAKRDGRIGRVAADPLFHYRFYVDIGGTGARADAFAGWIVQFMGREIRVLDYYEAQGQEIGHHLGWLRKRGYHQDICSVWLPHDGATQDKVYANSYESAFRQAGYSVQVVPNQGRGAAIGRIQAGRRRFPMCWFNEETTKAGLEALGWYHEKQDEQRNVGLGPEHDWSSHAADAFGMMCVVYAPPTGSLKPPVVRRAMEGKEARSRGPVRVKTGHNRVRR